MDERYTYIGKDDEIELLDTDMQIFGYNITKMPPPIAPHLNRRAKEISYQITRIVNSLAAIKMFVQKIKKNPPVAGELTKTYNVIKNSIDALNTAKSLWDNATVFSDDKLNYTLKKELEKVKAELKKRKEEEQARMLKYAKQRMYGNNPKKS